MIARIFPSRTSYTPTDEHAYFGPPDLFTPRYKEAHVSVVFTWDIPRALELARSWEFHADKVLIGGPAHDTCVGDFTPGMYVRHGVTFTSRGCIRKCAFCYVPKREGALRILPISDGNVIQDNNILATPMHHWKSVIAMLQSQRDIVFAGGLDARLITEEHVKDMVALGSRLRNGFFACDTRGALQYLERAAEITKPLPRAKKSCYVLIGDDYDENVARLERVWHLGFMPFAMLMRGDMPGVYDKKFRNLQSAFCRPAVYRGMMTKYGKYIALDAERGGK